jgi:protein-disulfide isomerase
VRSRSSATSACIRSADIGLGAYSLRDARSRGPYPASMRSRRTTLIVLGAVVVAAAALAATLVLVSRGSGGGSGTTTVAAARSLFAGIPQAGATLGSPTAPAVYEFADLQCPYCGEFARNALPTVVDRYVRTGKIRLVFRGLAFIGPDSEKALRAVAAAGLQDREWDVLDALYQAQGAENSGWVTDDLLRQVGESVAGLDVDRWLGDVDSSAVTQQIRASEAHATALGVSSTPTFVFGTRTLQLQALTADAFSAALDPLLAS